MLFIGQAPPRIKDVRPFGRTWLYRWFKEAGIHDLEIETHFRFTALVPFFPGLKGKSHRAPNPNEIASARPLLINTIRSVHPDAIVTVGILSAREVLVKPGMLLEEAVGNIYRKDPFDCLGQEVDVIPFPHPSGASSWIFKDRHRALLDSALHHLIHVIRKV